MKLFFVMIVFASTVSFITAMMNQHKISKKVIENNQIQLQQIEEVVKHSLETIDKAYYFFDQDTAEKMQEYSEYILKLYDENPNFDKWDFQKLKNELGMDIFIIDENNVVVNSSFKEDVGLDFHKCCKSLSKILDERRKDGRFFHDGIDLSQMTGEITKYSYMATPDKKY